MSEESAETLTDFINRTFDAASKAIHEPGRASLESLEMLTTTARGRRGIGTAWSYYHGSFRDRIGDVLTLADRLLVAQRELVDYRSSRPPDGGGTMDWRELTLPQQMRLDFEALYIFGNLALDQWAMLAATLAGDCGIAVENYQNLFDILQGSHYAGVLRTIWDQHSRDMIWLCYNLRFVRNCFIEHAHVARSRWTGGGMHTPDFSLDISPLVRPGEIAPFTDDVVRQIRDLGRRLLPAPLAESVEQERPGYVLLLLMSGIDDVPRQVDRETIRNLAEDVGVHTTSYHILASRLLRFFGGSLSTLNGVIATQISSSSK